VWTNISRMWPETKGRTALRIAFGCLLAVTVWDGCSPRSTPPAGSFSPRPTRGYIVISIDTLRADHLGVYGYDRDTSPSFDSLSLRGTLFERAVVQYPSTLTSHMTIFTGLYPQEHRVLPPSTVLAREIETLPEILQRQGFRTAGHTEGGFMAGGYGFARGFEDFTDTPYSSDTDVERTFARGLDFLRSVASGDRFFLFLHTYAVHDPYQPPERFRSLFWEGEAPDMADSSGEFLRRVNQGREHVSDETLRFYEAQYDATIRYVDEVLGHFVAELEHLGLLAETTLIITSDHGEEFGEHGKVAHTQIYPECLLVPLLVVHPQQEKGLRIGDLVELVDLAPTILEMAGLEPSSAMSGKSLVGMLQGRERVDPSSQAFAEVLDEERARTLMVHGPGDYLQLLMVEPEPDPSGPWIRSAFTFDTEESRLQFEAHSFHEPRKVEVSVDGSVQGELDLGPEWQAVTLELPGRHRQLRRVRFEADGCLSPAEVGEGADHRCLAFQTRGLGPTRHELYDLEIDPLAQEDLFRERTGLLRRLTARLSDLQWSPRAEPEDQQLSDADEEALRALGYLD
jgi:arylsulfatase A-like enzyme